MNIGLVSFIANIPTLACFGIAGWLASINAEGWGWFIAAGILVSKSITRSKDEDDDDEDPPSIPVPPKSVLHRN